MIDTQHLNSLTEVLGTSMVNDIRLAFEADSAEKMPLLQQAWTERNHAALREASHSLKSASLNMGLSDMATQCQLIESAAAQQEEQGIQAIIDRLPSLLTASLAELEAYFLNAQHP
ncbi:Hpt domain-containing protein [Marinomonas algarum]|uniref:Hpt domain-containing protein n=1 Tax=Marinomonas algarum TaxID=2883105 RepID=A0A9X1LC77_9GAMM|nr:Hpt domain-containing protein [Marinomonas algarum]MCB5161714.1 Hpt domain-containing protein [Marinomonas algarum]